MDHLRIMGFLVLLFTTLFAIQFAEARVLDHHFHNAALSQHNSLDLDAIAMASSRTNYSGAGGHVTNYSESNTESSSENSTHRAANNTIITIELLQKDATPGDGSSSMAPAGIKEVAPIEGNEDNLHEMLNSHSSTGVGHMSVNGGMEGNILSSSGQSPGVGHLEKSETKWKYSPSPARTTPNSVLSSGPSPGVGNGHTSAIASTQSELGTFNKLPSGPSPGVGHKVTNGYTEMAEESESKKSATIMNILPSGPSPGVGHSATNGRNTMEKGTKDDEEGMGIQTYNRLPSGSSPGVGHSYTNANLPDKIQTASASEDRKSSDHIPIFPKLPGGPSPGGGHSYVEKSASTVTIHLSSNALRKTSSSPSPGDGDSSMNKLKDARSQKKMVEQTGGALDRKIGCDGGGLDFYGTPNPRMFGMAAAGSLWSKLQI